MISFFANIFGYVLNFLYEIVGNFGLAIIMFSILIKLIMIPISIKQQKTLEKSQKVNEEMKQIQFKYKNDPEKMNQEVMALYKRENLSPFSGCYSAIAQIILLFSVFYLVRSPLTYMRKVDANVINNLEQVVTANQENQNGYKEIAVINYMNNLKNGSSVSEEENTKTENEESNSEIPEENTNNENMEENVNNGNEEENNENKSENNEDFNINDYIDETYVNMNFLGLDLSKVPTQDLTDIKVLIIPVLYVISSFISIRMSTNSTNKKKKEKLIGDGKNNSEPEEYDPMEQANKSMSWFMPIMSISIACIAPLGLALYWLMNNILMILERIILNKILKVNKEEAKDNA